MFTPGRQRLDRLRPARRTAASIRSSASTTSARSSSHAVLARPAAAAPGGADRRRCASAAAARRRASRTAAGPSRRHLRDAQRAGLVQQPVRHRPRPGRIRRAQRREHRLAAARRSRRPRPRLGRDHDHRAGRSGLGPDATRRARRCAIPKTLAETDGQPDGFQDFLLALRDEVIAFRKPVAYVHGDSHYFRVDKPFLDAQGRRLENFTRVETFGDNQAQRQQRRELAEGARRSAQPRGLRYQAQIVPANRTAVPAP